MVVDRVFFHFNKVRSMISVFSVTFLASVSLIFTTLFLKKEQFFHIYIYIYIYILYIYIYIYYIYIYIYIYYILSADMHVSASTPRQCSFVTYLGM